MGRRRNRMKQHRPKVVLDFETASTVELKKPSGRVFVLGPARLTYPDMITGHLRSVPLTAKLLVSTPKGESAFEEYDKELVSRMRSHMYDGMAEKATKIVHEALGVRYDKNWATRFQETLNATLTDEKKKC